MFKLNIKRHVSRTVPPFWRKLFTLSWLEVLLWPVVTLNETFVAWVDQKRIELNYNGQTIILEAMLNDLFDPTERRIRIQHTTSEREYDYFVSEGQAADFDYFISEAEPARYDYYQSEMVELIIEGFRVSLPMGLMSQEDQIRGNILKYKLATIEYGLTYF